jgi:phospholipid transport system substrate-binding protein
MNKLHPMAVIAPLVLIAPAFAQATAPDALVRTIAVEVLDAIRADPALQSGDLSKVTALVDSKVMPHVNFEVMTRSAVGPQWRGATPAQRQRLQAEFKTLLLRVYSGAMNEIRDQTVEVTRTLPVAGSSQVVVQSELRGRGEPIKLDYRMDKVGDTWKIIDVNVGGIWLVQSYRSQFATELNNGGIENLIARLAERNAAPAGRS